MRGRHGTYRKNVSVFIITQGKEKAMGNAPESDNWMNAVAIKDWLDAIVELRQRESQLKMFGSRLLLLEESEKIHVYSLIEFMAYAAGAELQEEVRYGKYPYRYSFIYKGIQFFQISEERLRGYICPEAPDNTFGKGDPGLCTDIPVTSADATMTREN